MLALIDLMMVIKLTETCSQPIKTSCNQVSKTLLCLTAILTNSDINTTVWKELKKNKIKNKKINLKNKKLLFRDICTNIFRSQHPYLILNDLKKP